MNYRIFSTLLLLSACCGLISCKSSHNAADSTQTSSGVITQQSLDAFQNTLYSFGQTQGCVKCHAANVNPLWMNPNVQSAYSFAAPLVDFTNPAGSVFAVYAKNNHCNDPICNNAANVSVVQDLLTQWAQVELAQGNSSQPVTNGAPLANPTYVSMQLPIPASLPLVTSGTPAVVRFDLSQLTPPVPALNGAIFELSIQSYNALGNEYKIFNPRLVGNGTTVSLSGIHVYVRPATGSGLGTEDANQGDLWAGVKVTVSSSALPSPLPTTPLVGVSPLTTISLGIPSQSASDVITVGFLGIQ